MTSNFISLILMRRYVTELVRSPRARKALGQNGTTWRTADQRLAVPIIPQVGIKHAADSARAS